MEERTDLIDSIDLLESELRAARRIMPLSGSRASHTVSRLLLGAIIETVSDPALPGSSKCASNCPVIRLSAYSLFFSGTVRYRHWDDCGEPSVSLSPPYMLPA